MSERIDAIFENGVFRPEVPVNIPNGERVLLDVERLHERISTSSSEAEAARQRFEQCFGSVDLGQPIGIDNPTIDADLAREYQTGHGSS
jgi:predicted DNA-binding antitoxin AbrB/MazE fold protein